MSQEKKDAQRERERLIKKAKHHTETQEECVKCRNTNCDSMMRKRQTETNKQGPKRKKTMQECVSKQRQTETAEQAAIRKKTVLDQNTRKQQTETEEQAAKCKKTNHDCLRRKREELRHRSQNDSRDCNGEDMTNVIYCATKEAKQFLHRTRDPANPHKHRATVCIICDCVIIGAETIHKLTKEDIGAHSERLGFKSYEENYQTTLKAEVKKQY
jgi:carboxypeptidase C (cathepsin A)